MNSATELSISGQLLKGSILNNSVTQELIDACMQGTDLADRAQAYLALTDYKNLAQLSGFVPDRAYPKFCIQYLFDCIEADLPSDPNDGVLSRGEALFELWIPMNRFWGNRDVALPNVEYWEMIEGFLRKSPSDLMDDFVTHFLESVDRSLRFRDRVPIWKTDPVLKQYLALLKDILGGR
jgi:hypothetical protein